MTVRDEIHAANESYEGRDLETLASLENYRRWILRDVAEYIGGRTVEIGAGTGNFSELLLPLADELVLVEPAARPFSILSERFAAVDHVVFDRRDGTDWAREAPEKTVDTIVMVNLLEHMEDDDGILHDLCRALRPGGTLVLFVPALMALYSGLDRRYGHFRRYHRSDLRSLLTGAGFDVVKSHYFDSAGAVAWFILNRLLGATTFNPFLVRTYDRLAVPVLRVIEGLVRPPCGKNLIFVGRRSRA